MGFIGGTWQLVGRHTGVVVGEILIEDADFPWLHGRFTQHPGFAPLRPLFERELALLDRIDEAYEEWELRRRAREGDLRDPLARPVPSSSPTERASSVPRPSLAGAQLLPAVDGDLRAGSSEVPMQGE